MPSTDVPLYKPLPADVQVTFDGRPPLSDSWEMSNNPCLKKTIRADGDLADWQGVTPIDLATCGRKRGKTGVTGTVMMAWDDANFYLAAKVTGGEILQFALAPTYSGRWSTTPNLRGWYEFAAQPGKPLTCLMSPNDPKPGPMPEATGMATKGGADTVYEIAIPWKKLAPITPSAGHVKLSVFVQDSPDTVGTGIEWGGGIAVGKSPDAFRLCRFDGGQGGKKEPGNVSEAINRVTPTPDTEQVLADSEIDFGIEQGFRNWSYGYYDGKGGGEGDAVSPMGPYTDDDFKPMQIETDIWGIFWEGPVKNFNLKPSNAHPTVIDGRQCWAVHRWKSTYDGTVHITGKALKDKRGDGVEARILIDGVAVYNGYVRGALGYDLQEHDIDCTATVTVGSLIDFALTPGKGLDASYDATPYNVRISASAAKKR